METAEILVHVLHIVIGQDSAAHVGPYHGDNGMVIACLKEDLGCKACLRENTVQHGVHGGMAVHEHKGLVLEPSDIQGGIVLPLLRRHACQRMSGGNNQIQFFLVYGFIDIVGPVLVCKRQEGNVQAANGYHLLKMLYNALLGFDDYVGIELVEGAVYLCKHIDAASCRKAHGEMAAFAVRQVVDGLVGFPLQPHNFLGIPDVNFPGLRQMPVGAGTVEQGSA